MSVSVRALVLASGSAEATRGVAGALAPLCLPGDVVLLVGDLGAGKTTFAQGFGVALGVAEPVTSPTFTLVRQYPVAGPGPVRTLLHADVYRLDHLHEIVDLGLGELVEDGAVALVEWGDLAEPVLGAGSLAVELDPGSDDTARRITVSSRRPGLGGPLARTGGGAGSMVGGGVNLLAIESATDMVGVALVRGDGASAERIHEGGRAHAELLAPAIEEVCAVSGCTLDEVGTIAVDIGPGLFTGLRVGVSTAKALGQALGIGVLGVSSLDVLAFAAAERLGPTDQLEAVAAVVDARRGEVFAAAYGYRPVAAAGSTVDPATVRDDRAEPLAPDALVDWLVEMAGVNGRVAVVGDGAVRYRNLLSGHSTLDLRWTGDLSAPPPLALARLALLRLADGALPADAVEIVPDYRRPADARINWEQRVPRPPHREEAIPGDG